MNTKPLSLSVVRSDSSHMLRELLQLTWPVFIAQLAVLVNGLIDTVMAGRLDAVELAAVGIGSSIVITVVVSCAAVLLALTPIIAHLHGGQRQPEIGEQVRQGVWVALGLSALGLALLRHPQVFFWLSHLQPVVEERVRAYLSYSCWSMPAILLFRVFSALSIGIGKPRAVMVLNLLGLALKVPLNYLFMYGHAGFSVRGGAGAALTSALIAWLVVILAWLWCARAAAYREFAVFERLSPPRLAGIGELLKLGLPIGAAYFIDISAFTFMALFVARLGPTASGAHQIAASIVTLTFQFPLALGNAASVLCGRTLGAQKPEIARRAGRISILTSISVAAGVSLLLWLGAPLIAAWYTTDLTVQEMAIPLITLVALYHLPDALQATTINVLRGYKITTVPMVVYAVALWGMGLGGGFVLALTDCLGHARGIAGFWLAAIASLAVASSIVVLYFQHVSKRASARTT